MHTARVALEIPEEYLHPMHAFVCESPAVDRETILERDARGEVTTLLLYVDGDREAYERRLRAVPQVEEWATSARMGIQVDAHDRPLDWRVGPSTRPDHQLYLSTFEIQSTSSVQCPHPGGRLFPVHGIPHNL